MRKTKRSEKQKKADIQKEKLNGQKKELDEGE